VEGGVLGNRNVCVFPAIELQFPGLAIRGIFLMLTELSWLSCAAEFALLSYWMLASGFDQNF
jgi:hypothetical protein